jgi:FkbM family methyltransferase
MPMTLRDFAHSVRHHPRLERMELLWNVLRTPYRKLVTHSGTFTMVCGGRPIRFPAHHIRFAWDSYEPEAMRAFVAWLEHNADGMVLDLGAAEGIYAYIGLAVSPRVQVLAVDGDLASLRNVMQLCGNANPRIRVVHGLVTEHTTAEPGRAYSSTSQELAHLSDQAPVSYVCVGDTTVDALPCYTVDDLLADVPAEIPLLVKLDIEGAELLALKGATQTLQRPNVTLLASVHYNLIQRYGHTHDDVASFLEGHGYTHRVLAIDTEAHWWCERRR